MKYSSNPNSWFCNNQLPNGESCSAFLGYKIGNNKVAIIGKTGQEYNIFFTFIELTCKKCNKKVSLVSDSSVEMMKLIAKKDSIKMKSTKDFAKMFKSNAKSLTKILPQRKSFYELSQSNKDKLLNNLSESQRHIYSILSKSDMGDHLSDKVMKAVFSKIADETPFGWEKITQDISKIQNEIFLLLKREIT